MRRINLIILICLLFVCLTAFAQSVDNSYLSADTVDLVNDNPTNTFSLSQDVSYLLSEQVASILAALLSALIGWLCLLIRKYLKIKVMESQVKSFIIRQAEQLEDMKADNDHKRLLVVQELKKDKKLSKWAKILHTGLEEAVSTVYKGFVKNTLKNTVRQINKLG